MAQRATSLGPNSFLFFCFLLFVVWGGFKGQVRWPNTFFRGTSLGPKPSLFCVFFFVFFCVLSLLSFLCF